MLSVIIPANNEEDYIGPCLEALLAQKLCDGLRVEIIVAANACTDQTVAIARSRADQAEARGWRLEVLDIAEGGKPNALNQADATAAGDMRLYLDADVICSEHLLSQLAAVLDQSDPAYASGKFIVTPAKSWITRRYVDLWTQLPFMMTGVPGGGAFAVNAEGRARWGEFPNIIADDSYARLQFKPAERIGVPAKYVTPLAEGFRALVRVRRRWDAGSRELARKYPNLLMNDDKQRVRLRDHFRLFLSSPASYLVYVCVILCARVGRSTGTQGWLRGR